MAKAPISTPNFEKPDTEIDDAKLADVAAEAPHVKAPSPQFYAISDVYGAMGSPDCTKGRVIIRAPRGETAWSLDLACHKLVELPFQQFFDALLVKGLYALIGQISPIYVPNDVLDGLYPPVYSPRAWGVAVALNAGMNHAGIIPPRTDPAEEGAKFRFWHGHPVVKLAQEFGFTWGGGIEVMPHSSLFMACGLP